MENQTTATERVKTFGPLGTKFLDLKDLKGYMEAKGFDLEVVSKLAQANYFARHFGELVLRTKEIDDLAINSFAQVLNVVDQSNAQLYMGSYVQNNKIGQAIANSGISSESARFGEGSATSFNPRFRVIDAISGVPIAIIGYGAAGIMSSYALAALGFRSITVYENSRSLGIWDSENVYTLSRNNPFNLSFLGRTLEKAPGSGHEVRIFLEEFKKPILVHKRKVVTIKPRDLNHEVTFADGDSKKFPIVINATGLGKPKQVSDPSRMVTDTGVKHAGVRWQAPIDRQKINNQRLVMIGLGNSTAEMLQQIHNIMDVGNVEVDYRVITHYPEDAVRNPSSYVPLGDKTYRVFRDISKPNLVDYQGDLPHSRHDYFRAMHAGKIISDVARWEVNIPNVMSLYNRAGKLIENIAYDKVMTLIGYAQSRETMVSFGCSYDDKNSCGMFDYDGEVIKNPFSNNANDRLHRGYFGFGSILEAPLNPNAIVIPGMFGSVGDLIFGVIMRSAEYYKNKL